MAKQIVLKSTANGTDYVMVQMILDGTPVAKFGSKIQPLKAMSDAGFLGAIGTKAFNEYVAEHGAQNIQLDAIKRSVENAKKKVKQAEEKARLAMLEFES